MLVESSIDPNPGLRIRYICPDASAELDEQSLVIPSLREDSTLAEGVSFVSSGKNADVDSVAAAAEETIIATAQFDAAVDASKQNGAQAETGEIRNVDGLDAVYGAVFDQSNGNQEPRFFSSKAGQNGATNGHHTNSGNNGNLEFFRDVSEMPDWQQRSNGASSNAASESSSESPTSTSIRQEDNNGAMSLNGDGKILAPSPNGSRAPSPSPSPVPRLKQ